MRNRGFFGFGLCVRRCMADEDVISLILQWRVEVNFLVWHWRIPLWRCRP